jgi:HipA-like protein
MRLALVYRNGELVGRLTEDDQRQYWFIYDPLWLRDASKPPLSLTMPKTETPYQSEILFPFFYNLLSEGANRKLQSHALQIDGNDHFGYLLATAQYDTIGAITVKPAHHIL